MRGAGIAIVDAQPDGPASGPERPLPVPERSELRGTGDPGADVAPPVEGCRLGGSPAGGNDPEPVESVAGIVAPPHPQPLLPVERAIGEREPRGGSRSDDREPDPPQVV